MSTPAPAKAEGGLPPWTLGLPRDESEIEATQRTRKRLAVERALRSKLLAPRVAGIRLRPARRSGRVGEDPGPHQGRAAQAPDRGVLRRLLHCADRRLARAVALGRCDRQAALLSALGRGPGLQPRRRVPAHLAVHRRASRRRRARLLPARHPSGRAAHAALGADGRSRDDLGRRRHDHADGGPARAHPRARSRRSSRRCRATRCISPTWRRRRASTSRRVRCASCW